MKNKEFAGKWVGQYAYGEMYGKDKVGKQVAFTLKLEIEGGGKIRGQITDDGYADQMDNAASFEGTISGESISFVKTYRRLWTVDKDQVKVHENRDSHEVHYLGELRNGEFAGEWKIFSEFVRPGGEIETWVLGGSWSMRREE